MAQTITFYDKCHRSPLDSTRAVQVGKGSSQKKTMTCALSLFGGSVCFRGEAAVVLSPSVVVVFGRLQRPSFSPCRQPSVWAGAQRSCLVSWPWTGLCGCPGARVLRTIWGSLKVTGVKLY